MATRPNRDGTLPTGATTTTVNYYSVTVTDATGAVILPPVRSYGPRGVTPFYGFDKNGAIVENGWSKKIELYLTINNENTLLSDRVKAIDTRIADATKDGLGFVSSLEAISRPDTHSTIYALVPTILSLAGIAVAGQAGGVVGQTVGSLIKLPNDDSTKSLFKNKVYTLDYEVKKLTILRADITGEYLQYDALGTKLELPKAVRSANTDNTLLWVSLALLFFLAAFYYLKKKRRQL